eukprot:1716152-Amphidinium_carterae.1
MAAMCLFAMSKSWAAYKGSIYSMHYNVNAGASSVSEVQSAEVSEDIDRRNPRSDRLHVDTNRQSEFHTAAGRQLLTIYAQIDSMLIPTGSLSSIPQPAGSPVPYSLR